MKFLENNLARAKLFFNILYYIISYIYLEYDLLAQLDEIGAFLFDFMLEKLSNILHIPLGIVQLLGDCVEGSVGNMNMNVYIIWLVQLCCDKCIFTYTNP